jgi:hypothetical protein
MPESKGSKFAASGALLAAIAAATIPCAADETADASRFSDQPAPLRLDDFPARPAPLIEIGDKFLSTGNLQKGYTLPTGAVWSPDLWVYGNYRTAMQSYYNGATPRTSEWANRLDLFGNLQLSPTERVLAGFRPLDQNGLKYTGYTFEPESKRGFNEAYGATPRTLFFEGEFGEIFPKLDNHDSRSLDYSFAIGRQPLTLQGGILANDGSIDMVSVTRNALRIPGGSTLRVSPFLAWSQIERGDNAIDHKATMFGVDMAADFPVSTVEATAIYVTSPGAAGFYAGVGAIQRIGKINTTFRANTSVATDQVGTKVSDGVLLTAELSYTLPHSVDIVYLNGFWGINRFTSADRDPTAGGPLGGIGILNAAVGIGTYGAPLSNFADHAAGGAIGYQMFFGELRRRQVVLEVGGRAPTQTASLLRQQAAEGVGARFQQAFGRRFTFIVDAYGVHREEAHNAYGGRTELLVKF